MNASAGGIGDGHPALLDLDVRHAIAMAIDRQTAVRPGRSSASATPGTTMSPSADPTWQPEEVPADIALDFDPDAANALLDEAGYVDTDGDGVREMPDGSRDLTFRYAERRSRRTSRRCASSSPAGSPTSASPPRCRSTTTPS